MLKYTAEELAEAKRSVASTLSKCEKALAKLTPGKSQHTLTMRRIQAFRLSLDLIDRESAATAQQNENPQGNVTVPGQKAPL